MNQKGVLGLSVETLVTIIISIVVLVGGISLLYQFIGGAEDIKSDLDQQTKIEIERLIIDQGKPVALPFNTATISRGEHHVFGIGVLNIGLQEEPNAPINTVFKIEIQFTKAVDVQGNEITPTHDVNSWVLYSTESFTLEENDHRSESILVSVPTTALQGQYIFTVRVLDGSGNHYGNIQKLYVTVK